MRATHFCDACGKVQPPRPSDYFAFFGLSRKLNLDTSQLEREFYNLSRKLHPDVYARMDAQEQSWSLEQSSRLNDAYRTLRDPVKRTEYMLRLEGVELEEQSKSATEAARQTGQVKEQVVPAELLEEVFELNMQLEELKAQHKLGEDDPALLEEIGKQKMSFQDMLERCTGELQKLWDEWDAAAANGDGVKREQVRDEMVSLLNRRNYIRNLVRDIGDVLQGGPEGTHS
ncbi:MAG: Fe-S protein assembly co-chaperone HscB [Acidobacteriales bacterium]|nr:Fe-S protein assembly co-chaperone HscB [Terriglobales bacterium]